MRILISTIFKYPHEGGLSTHITTLKHGLEEIGHEVDVISGTDFPKTLDLFTIKGPAHILNRLSVGKGQLVGDKRRKVTLQGILKNVSKKYDIINTQDIFATLAARQSHTQVTQTVHGYYTYEAISRGAIKEGSSYAKHLKQLERYAYEAADELICVDQRLKQYIQNESSRIANVVPNFINTKQFDISKYQVESIRQKYELTQNKDILLVPRRLTEKNGVLYPILALNHVLKAKPNILLVYAGSGELLDTLKNMVNKDRLENHVTFLGSVPHEDMIGLIKLSRAVLIPSVHTKGVEEATSIAALEGMAAGCPVIASSIGGLKEMIQNEVNGLLFQEKDVEGLANCILSILNQPMWAEEISNRAKKYIEDKHSHIKAAKKFENIYRG